MRNRCSLQLLFCSMLLITFGFELSCKPRNFNQDVGERGEGGGAEVAALVSNKVDEKVLQEALAIRLNLRTNIATLYEKGKPQRSWFVATARKDNRSVTPTGTFRMDELTVCQSWNSTRTQASKGPCDPLNPTGHFGLWFVGTTYGFHDVEKSQLKSVTDVNPEARRQSSGCVRTHPETMRWLVNKIAPFYGTTEAELSSLEKASIERSFFPLKRGVALVIGHWAPSTDKGKLMVLREVSPQ